MFKSIGITGTSTGFLTTGIFGVVKCVVTLIWLLWLIDRLGRRNLLIIGAAGGSFCMWFIGAYIKLSGAGSDKTGHGGLSSGGIAAVFFFYLWTAFYTVSSTPLPIFTLLLQFLTKLNSHLGMEHPGSSTRKCSHKTLAPSAKPPQLQTTGSGTSSSHVLHRRCSLRWDMACTSSSPR